MDRRSTGLAAIGYETLGEYGIPGRRYFRRGGPSGARTHHVHAFQRRHPQIERMLLFRDYLRATPATAHEYALLKRRLAARSADSIQTYAESKTDFVELVLSKARLWAMDPRGRASNE